MKLINALISMRFWHPTSGVEGALVLSGIAVILYLMLMFTIGILGGIIVVGILSLYGIVATILYYAGLWE